MEAARSSSRLSSSAFRSSSSQRMKAATEDTPGVGSYDPRMSSVEPSCNSSVSGMKAKSERFKAESMTTDPAVGPGAHETIYDSHGNRATVGAVAQANTDLRNQYGPRRAQSAAFSSDVVRDLPY